MHASRCSRQRIGRRATARGCAIAIVLGLPFAAMSAAGATTASAHRTPAPVVKVDGGVVRSIAASTGDAFLGLPYAAPRSVDCAGECRSRRSHGQACATPRASHRPVRNQRRRSVRLS